MCVNIAIHTTIDITMMYIFMNVGKPGCHKPRTTLSGARDGNLGMSRISGRNPARKNGAFFEIFRDGL